MFPKRPTIKTRSASETCGSAFAHRASPNPVQKSLGVKSRGLQTKIYTWWDSNEPFTLIYSSRFLIRRTPSVRKLRIHEVVHPDSIKIQHNEQGQGINLNLYYLLAEFASTYKECLES